MSKFTYGLLAYFPGIVYGYTDQPFFTFNHNTTSFLRVKPIVQAHIPITNKCHPLVIMYPTTQAIANADAVQISPVLILFNVLISV